MQKERNVTGREPAKRPKTKTQRREQNQSIICKDTRGSFPKRESCRRTAPRPETLRIRQRLSNRQLSPSLSYIAPSLAYRPSAYCTLTYTVPCPLYGAIVAPGKHSAGVCLGCLLAESESESRGSAAPFRASKSSRELTVVAERDGHGRDNAERTCAPRQRRHHMRVASSCSPGLADGAYNHRLRGLLHNLSGERGEVSPRTRV